jgi:hypothetical protein
MRVVVGPICHDSVVHVLLGHYAVVRSSASLAKASVKNFVYWCILHRTTRLFIGQDHPAVYCTGPCGCLLDRTIRLFIAHGHAIVYCSLYADVYCMRSFIVCGCLLLVYCMLSFSKRHSFLYERYNYRSHADVMLE